MFEQQKDRTYRHGVTKNYGFVDNLDEVVEDCKHDTVSIRQLKELLDEAIHNGLENHPVYVRLGKDNRKDIKFLSYQVGRDGFFEVICEE